eukprot:245440_1
MDSSALRDLSKIQSFQASTSSKHKHNNDKAEQEQKTKDLMNIIVCILKEKPHHEMTTDKLMKELKQKHAIKTIKKACGLKNSKFFDLMKYKKLITIKLINNGTDRCIKLIDFDDSELNYRINQSVSKWDRLEKTHHKQISKLCKWTIEILSNMWNKQMDANQLQKKLSHKFSQPLVGVFHLRKVKYIWKYLQHEKKIITLKSSADGTYTLINLNIDSINSNMIQQPPLKKRKLNKCINDYNDGKINENTLIEKIVKTINKLECKYEIHFHFKLKKPMSMYENDIDLSDSEIENDECVI